MKREDGGVLIGTTFVFWAISLQCCAQSANGMHQSPVRIGQLVAAVTEYRVVSIPGAYAGRRSHFEMATLQVRNASAHPNCTSFKAALAYEEGRGYATLRMPPNRTEPGPRMSGLAPGEESKGSYIFEVEDDWKPSGLVLERDRFGERNCADTLDQPVDLSGGNRVVLSRLPLRKGHEDRTPVAGIEAVNGFRHPSPSDMDAAPAQLGQLRITPLDVRHGLALNGGGVIITPRKGYHYEAVILAAENTSSYENCTKLDPSLGVPEEGAELYMNLDSRSLNPSPGSKAKICYIFLVHHSVQPRIFTLRLKPKDSDANVQPWMSLDNPDESGCPPISDVHLDSDTAFFHLQKYERAMEDTLDGTSLSGRMPPQ